MTNPSCKWYNVVGATIETDFAFEKADGRETAYEIDATLHRAAQKNVFYRFIFSWN